jgi:transposase
MANKTISMSKLKQIIKLYCQGTGKKTIGKTLGTSRNTVKTYVEIFKSLKTTWIEISTLSDHEFDKLFHPEKTVDPPERLKILHDFFPYAEKKLRQRGVTVNMLWEEYISKHPDGYKTTQFNDSFKAYRRRVTPSMHMDHKAGDKMYVDFTGEKLSIVDPQTAEIKMLEVFVAVLGASQYTYVEAVESQTVEDFISCCENALHFYGGSPTAIVPDNLKSAVIKSSKYEPTINTNFERFADHYSMAVVPARAYKPKDKALVEGAVKIIYTRIFTRLSQDKYTSVSSINKAIYPFLYDHNARSFKGRSYSRLQQFEEMEKQALEPLPQKRFEMRKQLDLTVMKNGHVHLGVDKHYYSVPYSYISKKVRLLFSKSFVEIYHRHELIASHPRIKSPHNYTTDPAHMASQHQFVSDWSPDYFLKQAREISADVEYYIAQVLLKKNHPEQAYRSCHGILSFAKRVGKERLIRACQRAHGYGLYHYHIIENILQRGLDQYDEDDTQSELQFSAHENIRGENYYK